MLLHFSGGNGGNGGDVTFAYAPVTTPCNIRTSLQSFSLMWTSRCQIGTGYSSLSSYGSKYYLNRN